MAKRIEDLTTEEQATFRSEISAGTPATTDSTLALLADTDLEVASIGLTDGTGTALAAGRLSLNAGGDVVVHDNDSNTEDLPHLINSLESLNFATFVAATSMDNVNFTRKLADIPLPASALTNNKKLHITGRTSAGWSTANKPSAGAFLILCKQGQNVETEGMYLNFAEGVYSEERAFHLMFFFTVAASVWTLAGATSTASAFVQKNNGGTITHAAGWSYISEDWNDNSPITGAAGEPVMLELHLFTVDDSDAVTSNLFLSGQLSVIHE